jgi:hypothetical protein
LVELRLRLGLRLAVLLLDMLDPAWSCPWLRSLARAVGLD